MPIMIRILGSLNNFLGKKEMSLQAPAKKINIRWIINQLTEKNALFSEALIDPILGCSKPNALILLNGVEISNLEGFDTNVFDNSEIIFLSVTHGG
jgi:molybdopterin converting factor small subunit